MWGNAFGWKISGGIFVITVVFGWWLHGQMQITDPTNLSLDPKNLTALSPPMPAEAVVDQTEPGDAGEKYSAAVSDFDDEANACDDFAQKPQGPVPRPMQLVIDAMHLAQMNLFAKDPGSVVDYLSDHPVLDNLARLGADMENAALLLNRGGQTDDARKFAQAAYALGRNLLLERVDYDEYSKGMGLMDGATTVLAEMEPDKSDRRQSLDGQQTALVDFNDTRVRPIYEALASVDPQAVALNAGDVYRFATQSQERMIRVEAILKLGRYRFNSARAADQLAAPRVLRRLSEDSDPVIRAAAKAASELTVEQYRMIH
jgi:hypothetical protein